MHIRRVFGNHTILTRVLWFLDRCVISCAIRKLWAISNTTKVCMQGIILKEVQHWPWHSGVPYTSLTIPIFQFHATKNAWFLHREYKENAFFHDAVIRGFITQHIVDSPLTRQHFVAWYRDWEYCHKMAIMQKIPLSRLTTRGEIPGDVPL